MIAPSGFEFVRSIVDEHGFDHVAPIGSMVGLCGSGVATGGRTTSSMRVCRSCSRLLAAKTPERAARKVERQRSLLGQTADDRAGAFERATGGAALVPSAISETPWCMGPIVDPDVDGVERHTCRYRAAIVVRGGSDRDAYFCSNENHRRAWTSMLERRDRQYRIEPANPADLERLREARRARRTA